MKLKSLLGAGVLIAAFTAGAAAALSLQQEKGVQDAKHNPAMEKWAELAKPGPAHKALDPHVGKWTVKVKHMMEPGAPAVESDATSEVKWIMDGRYLQEEVNGSFMGQPFKGIGICGYDNLKQKYVSSWIDNMNTGIATSEGTQDAASKTFNYTTECPDPMTGKYSKGRTVQKWTDNDHYTMQMFGPGPDGKEMMHMELNATRAK